LSGNHRSSAKELHVMLGSSQRTVETYTQTGIKTLLKAVGVESKGIRIEANNGSSKSLKIKNFKGNICFLKNVSVTGSKNMFSVIFEHFNWLKW